MKGVYPGAVAKGCPPVGSWGMGYVIITSKRDNDAVNYCGEDRSFVPSKSAVEHMKRRAFR